ncbi:MAG: hypothetical protein ABII79_07960 [bacterium]
MKLWLTTSLFVLLSLGAGVGAAENPPDKAANAGFVDLDGDGLNDNLPDLNYDGIPDFDKADQPAESFVSQSTISDFLNSMDSAVPRLDLVLSNSDGFRGLMFQVRGLSQCRGGFGDDENFGPGYGIGQGAMKGGCVGGACVGR